MNYAWCVDSDEMSHYSEDTDKMSHNAAFHQGLHCLLRQIGSSEK